MEPRPDEDPVETAEAASALGLDSQEIAPDEAPQPGPAGPADQAPQHEPTPAAGETAPEPAGGPDAESGEASPSAEAPAVPAGMPAEPAPAAAAEADHDPEPAPDDGAEPEPDADADTAEDRRAAADQPERPAPRTVAELVAASLRAAGVRMAFTVPGESFLPLLDALEAAGIRIVATRHEGAAAFAAEAYGQLTGRPAACLGTRAVGATNLAIGIHTAYADSTPMFVVVGGVDRPLRGREAFQEVDLVGSLGRLAAWAGEIDDPAMAAAQLATATRHALGGRPGPVLLVLPEDVLDERLPEGTSSVTVRVPPETPDEADVRAALHFLAAAERPVILAGAGVLRARCSNDLVRLAELLHVPVVASWRRGDVIPNDHPLYLGMTGFGSPSTVRERLEAADALLVLGSRLNEITTSGYRIPAAGQRWMHIDLAPRTGPLGTSPAPDRAIRADARAFVRAALAKLKGAVLAAEPLRARDGHNPVDRAAWEAATIVNAEPWSGPGVHPGRIVTDLRRLLPDDAILTTDAGAFAGWAARGFRFRRPGTFLGPTSGAMGYGLPAAIAAALVHRERRVVALLGDGGLGMTLAELETAVREEAHIVAIVFDNQQYGMIRAYQDRQGSPTSPGTTLGPVDFAMAARALGARGVRVETDAAFEPALRTALAAAGPTLIHLVLDRRWVSVDRPAVEEVVASGGITTEDAATEDITTDVATSPEPAGG